MSSPFSCILLLFQRISMLVSFIYATSFLPPYSLFIIHLRLRVLSVWFSFFDFSSLLLHFRYSLSSPSQPYSIFVFIRPPHILSSVGLPPYHHTSFHFLLFISISFHAIIDNYCFISIHIVHYSPGCHYFFTFLPSLISSLLLLIFTGTHSEYLEHGVPSSVWHILLPPHILLFLPRLLDAWSSTIFSETQPSLLLSSLSYYVRAINILLSATPFCYASFHIFPPPAARVSASPLGVSRAC